MGKLVIQKPGLFTSIQDGGRHGYRKYGVPTSGFMDQQSARLANLLVNNPVDAPLLEITLMGPRITLEGSGVFALTGANLSPKLDGKSIDLNTPVPFSGSQQLTFGKQQCGVRCYLAIHGRLKVDSVLGSASQYAPVTGAPRLEAGDVIYFEDSTQSAPRASVKEDLDHFKNDTLEVYPGPEWELLSKNQQTLLSTEMLTIGENNRMGYQLQAGGDLKNDLSIITSPVIPGTVQLTPSGKLIILTRDGQVTGGYPRILQLSETSINRLAQKQTGVGVRFDMVG